MIFFRDSNRSKLNSNDEIIFSKLREEFFPGVDCPPILHPDFKMAVETSWAKMDYEYVEGLVTFAFIHLFLRLLIN